jgi:kynurenine formamidase
MAVLLLGASHSNPAEETNWGKWGADDQMGTWNYVTPEVIRHALTLVRKGEAYLLALPIEPDQMTASNRDDRIYRYMASTGQSASREPAFAEDELFTPVHGPTHWDGLAHIMGERKLYNGYDSDTYVTDRGALRNGVQNVSNKMVTRGVLVDIARDQGVKRLSAGHLVTVEDIETAARHEGVSFLQGDVVFIRTGWMSIWYEQGKYAYRHTHGAPGIGWGVSQWLKRNRAAAVGVDTVDQEIMPCEPEALQMIHQPKWDMPIHYELIRNQGMMLMDISYLDELAEACARDHVYEFLFIGGALNIINGTGSPACPLAIK